MALIPWKNKTRDADGGELAPLANFRDEMNQLMESFFRDPLRAWMAPQKWSPAMDLEENDNEFVVRAEVPGMTPEEIDLSVAGDRLVLSGEKSTQSEKQGAGGRSERHFGWFRREISLPGNVDTSQVTAECKDGVLTVHLKKLPQAQAKRISVKAQ
jgi:HSP20 family protein